MVIGKRKEAVGWLGTRVAVIERKQGFQLAVIAPLINLIGYDTATAQS